MQEITGPRSDNKVEARYRILLILWFAFLMSVGFIFLLTIIIPRPQSRTDNVLMIVLISISALLIFVSIVPKNKLLEQAAQKQQPQLVQTAYIIMFALTEGVSLCGLLLYFVTPDQTYFVSFASSALLMFLHFPRRSHLMAAAFKSQ